MVIEFTALFLIGILSGGIVNILADSLPDYNRPSAPRNPDGTPRPPQAWLGITAFLTDKRAWADSKPLGWRYPLAEIGTGLLMLLVIVATANDPEVSDVQRVFYLIYMPIFVLITVIDIEHRLILFSVIIPSVIIALLDAVLTPVPGKQDLGTALLGGLVGFGVFFLLYLGGGLFVYVMSRIRGEELTEVAFGYGDVMLAGLSGLILGWAPLIFAIFITVFLGSFGALVYMAARSITGRYDVFTALPYGPYIIMGTLTMMLFSNEVQAFLWSL